MPTRTPPEPDESRRPSPAEPRWLSPAELETWLSVAALAVRLPAALDAQLLRDAGLSHFEYAVLARLSEAPENAVRMSELAAMTNGSRSRLSHVVARLERHGLVRRESRNDAGRVTLAVLTERGLAAVVAAAPGHVECVRRLVFDRLGENQQRQLKQAARTILAQLDAGPRPPR